MLFYYLTPLQNVSIVTSRCMQFTFGDKMRDERFNTQTRSFLYINIERVYSGYSLPKRDLILGPKLQYSLLEFEISVS